MNLITPASDCTDSELDARIAYFDLRRQPQPLDPQMFIEQPLIEQLDSYNAWQASLAPQPDYTLHTAECATDEDGPAGDLRSMGGLVLAFKAFAVVVLIALAVVFL